MPVRVNVVGLTASPEFDESEVMVGSGCCAVPESDRTSSLGNVLLFVFVNRMLPLTPPLSLDSGLNATPKAQ